MTYAALLTILYALCEGRYDFKLIDAHKPVNHVRGWIRRALVIGVLGVVYWWRNGSAVHAFVLCMGLAFLFSGVFRAGLNWWRGKAWWYIGAQWVKGGSIYDGIFHCIAMLIRTSDGPYVSRDPVAYYYWMPGTLAYLTEAVIAAGAGVYLL